jgi:hypothetical protein
MSDSRVCSKAWNHWRWLPKSIIKYELTTHGEPTWALSSVGENLEETIMKAKRSYLVREKSNPRESVLSPDQEKSDNDDYESMSDTDSDGEGAFSEYGNDACPVDSMDSADEMETD